jgi:hypothetical protein
MIRNTARIIGTAVLAMGVLLLCKLPLAAEDLKPTVNTATASGVTPRLDELAKLPQPLQMGFHEMPPLRVIPKPNYGHPVDPVEQRGTVAPSTNYSIIANILGVGNGFPGYTVPDAPPDTNMAVGGNLPDGSPGQILQWVNVSYTICSKASPYTCGPAILGNTLWAHGIPGTLCANNNSGDILAQYDRTANRWFLSQNVFVMPYATCIAISDTSDANGTWHVWQFRVPNNGFPDYPKIGIWPTSGVNNGYYQAQNNFGIGGESFLGPEVCAYDRSAMLSGAPSPTQICIQLPIGPNCDSQGIGCQDSLLPGDLDSILGPPNTPAGTPQDEFYIGSVNDVDNSHLSLYQFHADFRTPANSFLLGSPNTILQPVPTYGGSCSGYFGGGCVPSLGDPMDSLGDRLMYRFVYYNNGPAPSGGACATCQTPHFQHWYVNGDVESSTGQIGVRWYEFRAPTMPGIGTLTSSTLTTYQAGTYVGVPADENYRWMGSVAADKAGDICVGYSKSSASTNPAIDVACRQNNDPVGLNNLEPETLVVQGNGSQIYTAGRWGDYSAMRIDPVDNCTFWYTSEYYMVTQSFDWSTQMASIQVNGCH